MLKGLTGLPALQLAGNLLSAWWLPMLPGAVIGMLLLFGYLLIHGRVDEPLNQAASGLLNYLPLLLGPATLALAVPLYLNLKRIRLLVLAKRSLMLGRQASSAETRVAEQAGA